MTYLSNLETQEWPTHVNDFLPNFNTNGFIALTTGFLDRQMDGFKAGTCKSEALHKLENCLSKSSFVSLHVRCRKFNYILVLLWCVDGCRSQDYLQKLILSFHHACVDSMHLYPLHHFTSPPSFLSYTSILLLF